MSRRTPRPVFLNCGVITRSAIQPAQPCAYHTLISDDRFQLTGCRLASPDLFDVSRGPGGLPPIYFRKITTAGGSDGTTVKRHNIEPEGCRPVGADARRYQVGAPRRIRNVANRSYVGKTSVSIILGVYR